MSSFLGLIIIYRLFECDVRPSVETVFFPRLSSLYTGFGALEAGTTQSIIPNTFPIHNQSHIYKDSLHNQLKHFVYYPLLREGYHFSTSGNPHEPKTKQTEIPNKRSTLPETNSKSTWKWAGPQKETIVFQPSIFRCENAVSFRECNPGKAAQSLATFLLATSFWKLSVVIPQVESQLMQYVVSTPRCDVLQNH